MGYKYPEGRGAGDNSSLEIEHLARQELEQSNLPESTGGKTYHSQA